MAKKADEQFSEREARLRMEAALRGAREVGHKQMKDIKPKRPSHSDNSQRPRPSPRPTGAKR
jgi:hypothetical protein